MALNTITKGKTDIIILSKYFDPDSNATFIELVKPVMLVNKLLSNRNKLL